MGLIWSSYYQFARTSNVGPEVKNWAVTDTNWQLASLLLKRQEQHHHNASTPMNYPGYNVINPATPATPLLTLSPTTGQIAAGTSIGVRLSFVDQYGLETQGSPEQTIQTPAVVLRPNAPVLTAPVATPVAGGLPGGTYIYVITKRQNTGESQPSDVAVINVPFNSTANSSYTVPIQFDPISTYSDGTDSLLLYRTTGFDTNFVLLQSFTATPGRQNNINSYTDNGSVSDATHQPPSISEFGKQNAVIINWSSLNIPATAYRFRVYLTQQTGVWSESNLYQDYALVNPATPFPSFVTYTGVEALSTGYPLDFTQIPFGAPLVNLSTEAIGAPVYTTQANASGYQTWNFIFPIGITQSTPMFGAAYVDPNGQLKLCLSTPSGPAAPGVFTTLAGVGSGYAHPNVESGGHSASHIQAAAALGGPTQDQLNNIFSTPVAGGSQRYRTQATSIYKVTATPADLQTNAGSFVGMGQNANAVGYSDMDTINQFPTGISPKFAGQWFEIIFQANGYQFTQSALNGTGINFAIYINGARVADTVVSQSLSIVNAQDWQTWITTLATPLTRSNNRIQVQWFSSSSAVYTVAYGGNVVGTAPRRSLVIRELF